MILGEKTVNKPVNVATISEKGMAKDLSLGGKSAFIKEMYS